MKAGIEKVSKAILTPKFKQPKLFSAACCYALILLQAACHGFKQPNALHLSKLGTLES